MKTDHIKIHVGSTVHDPETYIELNGQRLSLVQAVNVNFSVNDQKMTRVTITMLTRDLDIEGDVKELVPMQLSNGD